MPKGNMQKMKKAPDMSGALIYLWRLFFF